MAIKNLRNRNAGPRSATTIQWDAAIGQATQVLSSADMIEDYNNAMLPPCWDKATTFCAVINSSGQTELVTVSDQNQLLWL